MTNTEKKKEYDRLKVAERKKNNLCIACGKHKPEKGKLSCKKCSEANRIRTKELYDYCKSKGICVKCKREKAQPGKSMCLSCSFDSSESKVDYYKNLPEDKKNRRRLRMKRKKDLCVAFGICVNCMKRNATNGQKCLECYTKQQRANRKSSLEKDIVPRSLRTELGLCYICGKPHKEGSKLCESCYEVSKKNMLKGRNKYYSIQENSDKHSWRLSTELAIKIANSKKLNKNIAM